MNPSPVPQSPSKDKSAIAPYGHPADIWGSSCPPSPLLHTSRPNPSPAHHCLVNSKFQDMGPHGLCLSSPSSSVPASPRPFSPESIQYPRDGVGVPSMVFPSRGYLLSLGSFPESATVLWARRTDLAVASVVWCQQSQFCWRLSYPLLGMYPLSYLPPHQYMNQCSCFIPEQSFLDHWSGA
jgi:hypothetical protein